MNGSELRTRFREFFVARGHTAVPSASLVPHDPTLLFTVAGMVPFKRYFLGEETPPYRRAVTVQKCVRAGGKHNDLDGVGTTLRHLTFFEMLGNFSFGDYFKDQAIPFAWEFVGEVLQFDPDRLWVTVHETDDEAEAIWRDVIGFPATRIQRLGADNWWEMGGTGPCGPCSEIFYDMGPEFGSEGGPGVDDGDRYREFWNLVFMQYDTREDGTRVPLPQPSIDTGGGLERITSLLEGVDSVFETDMLAPVLETAQSVTGRGYGRDFKDDVGLRVLADHARSATFLVSDGVLPSNEGRGYVLRRIIRRAALRGSVMGASGSVLSPLVESVISVMKDAYPELVVRGDVIREAIAREENRFGETLKLGYSILSQEIPKGNVVADVAFRLHDTFGFPIELTKEVADEQGVSVDLDGFESLMVEQRERARAAGMSTRMGQASGPEDLCETDFVGYETLVSEAKVVRVVPTGDGVDLFVDVTPFYPEGGGQVGDTGVVRGSRGEVEIVDTERLAGGAIVHHLRDGQGLFSAGDEVMLEVDSERRNRLRANHTATHLLHWALRRVLGDHVAQQGSLVAPDYLRFDFTHWQPVTRNELDEVERVIMSEIIRDEKVVTELLPRAEALRTGAIAFFGERYGEQVRMVRAGAHSLELCGGTHLDRLGSIGFVRIISETSVGANIRRVVALTQRSALERVQEDAAVLSRVASRLGVAAGEVEDRSLSLIAHQKELEAELRSARSSTLDVMARELAVTGKWLVKEVSGVSPKELRELALKLRNSIPVVVLALAKDDSVSLVAAVAPGLGVGAAELLAPVAAAVGGGVGRGEEVAVSGGRKVENLGPALELVAKDCAARWPE